MFGFGKKRKQDGAEAPETRTARKDGPPAWPEDPDALSAEELRSLATRFSALGTPEGTASANRLHLKAAEKGDALAQLYVAQDYANGLGVDRDPEKAAEWYAKAARQGLASAQDALGMAYEKGTGVAQDPEKAAELYREAAGQGYAMAQFHLGKLYEDGRGVARDFAAAADLYRKAAEQGSKEAQCNLGVLYRDGTGVELDPAKAVELLSKSAAQGYKYAQFELGMMYYRGRGTEVDYPKAVEWLTKAADRGFIPAKYYLGTCYEKGLGVEADFDKAVELYKAGEDRGYMMAGRSLKYILISHNESDEDGALGLFHEKFPEVSAVCSAMTARELKGYGYEGNVIAAAPGLPLEAEGVSIQFVAYPSEVHMNDGLLFFEEHTRIFYSSDLFFSTGNTAGKVRKVSWDDAINDFGEARIPEPRRNALKASLKSVSPLFVAAGHGVCLDCSN